MSMAPLFDIQLPEFDSSHWWLKTNCFFKKFISPGILLLNQEQGLEMNAVFKLMTLFLQHKGTKQTNKLESIFFYKKICSLWICVWFVESLCRNTYTCNSWKRLCSQLLCERLLHLITRMTLLDISCSSNMPYPVFIIIINSETLSLAQYIQCYMLAFLWIMNWKGCRR